MELQDRIRAMPQVLAAVQTTVDIGSKDISDEMALAIPALFPSWEPDTSYIFEQILEYNGELYRVAQNHTSQAQWIPGQTGTESLYTHITIDPETGYEEWKQPTGAHDAYSFGDIVTHNGKTWVSNVPGEHTNTWEPGVYGWDEHTEN